MGWYHPPLSSLRVAELSLLACICAGWSTCSLAQAHAPVVANAPETALTATPKSVPLEVFINGAPAGSWLLLDVGGVLYANAQAFEEWRLIRAASAKALHFRGQAWYSIHSVRKTETRLDFAAQALHLTVPATAFAASQIDATLEARKPPDPVAPALFLNYDTSLSMDRLEGTSSMRQSGALFELGYSSGLGVLTSSHLVNNLVPLGPEQQRTHVRLETTLTRDFPQHNLSLRLGDGSTRVGLTGRSVYFGGIQLARNFSLTPGFNSQPVPLLAGTTAAPSTVELFVNDALRHTSSVPAGPFSIENVPGIGATGQMRMVVRDILGRETVIEQPFFSHGELLAQGLSDWSLELGALRKGLGSASADYGAPFASGLIRYGLRSNLTAELRAEATREMQGASAAAMYALPDGALGSAAISMSRHDQTGAGAQWQLGMERAGKVHGYALRLLRANHRFRQLGMGEGLPPARYEFAANYTFNTGNDSNWGLTYARIESFERPPVSSYSLSYSTRIGDQSALSINLVHTLGTVRSTSVGMNLTVPMEGRRNSVSSVNHRAGVLDFSTALSEGPSGELGWGWRANAGARAGQAYSEGGTFYQGDRAMLSADASVSKNRQALRLGMQGGVVLMDGSMFLTRRVENSFALVDVPGLPNVGLGLQGSKMTRTDARGRALLSHLTPFEENRIRLVPEDLPLSAEIDDLEKVVVPSARSGVKLQFAVRTGRAALVRIVMQDGSAAPGGAQITIDGDNKEFLVARRGEVFVTGLQARNTLRLKHNGATCSFQLDLTHTMSDDIARVGPFTCTSTSP